MKLVSLIQTRSVSALARAISLVENNAPEAIDIIKAIYHHSGRAQVIGITGPPGAGKSTLAGKLATRLRAGDKAVAVLAVDPSSPFTGGAVLGDRVRMHTAISDPAIFVRSLASRGHLGGLSLATGNILLLLDAAGFDYVLVETVGAGQSEVEIMELAHTVCVVLAPGMGDELQTIKAGILEIGDLLVVNKADRPDAAQTARQLRSTMGFLHMGKEGLNLWPDDQPTPTSRRVASVRKSASIYQLRSLLQLDGAKNEDAEDNEILSLLSSLFADRYGSAQPGCVSWHPPVVKTSATNDSGITDMADRIVEHRSFLERTGQWESRKKLGIIARFESQLRLEATKAVLQRARHAGLLQQLLTKLDDRSIDPYTAAEVFIRTVLP